VTLVPSEVTLSALPPTYPLRHLSDAVRNALIARHSLAFNIKRLPSLPGRLSVENGLFLRYGKVRM